MSDAMPAQSKTQELPAADPAIVLLTQIRQEMASGFTDMRKDLETVKNDGQRTNLRLTRQEVRMDEVEMRLASTSDRVRSASKSDLDHESKLAAEINAREALATDVATIKSTNEAQLAILARLDKVASNPTVKVVLFLIGTLVTGYLATKGVSK